MVNKTKNDIVVNDNLENYFTYPYFELIRRGVVSEYSEHLRHQGQ